MADSKVAKPFFENDNWKVVKDSIVLGKLWFIDKRKGLRYAAVVMLGEGLRFLCEAKDPVPQYVVKQTKTALRREI